MKLTFSKTSSPALAGCGSSVFSASAMAGTVSSTSSTRSAAEFASWLCAISQAMDSIGHSSVRYSETKATSVPRDSAPEETA